VAPALAYTSLQDFEERRTMRGRLIRWLLPLMLVAAVGVGAAMAATGSTHSRSGTVKAAERTSFGMILVSSSGRTLYRYTVDSKGVNRCSSNATCNKFWPPLVVKAGVKPTVGAGARRGLLGTIKAAHGMRQVTYAGFPLYFFAGDKAAGQVKGQGFDSKWYVVDTRGALVKHAMTTSTTTSTSTSGGTTTSGSTWG
jgi:predicted lipoprotein with Yx(FWY)xxD motif